MLHILPMSVPTEAHLCQDKVREHGDLAALVLILFYHDTNLHSGIRDKLNIM